MAWFQKQYEQEQETSGERDIGSVIEQYTPPKFAQCSLEERLFALNIRVMSTIAKKVAQDDVDISGRLQKERDLYTKTVAKLKDEYRSETEMVTKLQDEVTSLKIQNDKMKEKEKKIKSKHQELLVKCEIDRKEKDELISKLKSMDQTVVKKTQAWEELKEKNKDLKEKNSKLEISNGQWEKRNETNEEKLKLYVSIPKRPETYEEFIDLFMHDVANCIHSMQNLFWMSVKDYFDRLEREFTSHILTIRKTEIEDYKTRTMDQQLKFERKIGVVYAERKEDARRIAKLEEEKLKLEEEIEKQQLQIEHEYNATKQVIPEQTFEIVLDVRRVDEDEGIREQVHFYEAVADIAEKEDDEMNPGQLKIEWDKSKKWFLQDPPEFIRNKIESVSKIFEMPSQISEEAKEDFTCFQDGPDPQQKPIIYGDGKCE